MKYKFKDIKYLVPNWTKEQLEKNQNVLEYIEDIHTKKLNSFNDLQSFLNIELPRNWIRMFGFYNVNCIYILDTKHKKTVQEMVKSGFYKHYKTNINLDALYIKLINPHPDYPSAESIINRDNNMFKESLNEIRDSIKQTFG